MAVPSRGGIEKEPDDETGAVPPELKAVYRAAVSPLTTVSVPGVPEAELLLEELKDAELLEFADELAPLLAELEDELPVAAFCTPEEVVAPLPPPPQPPTTAIIKAMMATLINASTSQHAVTARTSFRLDPIVLTEN